MKIEPLPLVVGVPGHSLSPEELATLERVRPAGIILFARNIESPDQVRDLVASVQELDPRPFVSCDLEGGAVNRLASLWGTLPSPSRAAASGRRAVHALGEAAGAACRSLGIHLNFAPVVDLEVREGLIAKQSRTLADEPDRIATLARVFADGMKTWCVGACIKHFPGLGAVHVDTHEELPTLELSENEMAKHLQAFEALSAVIPIVMVGHVVVPSLGDAERPASLSRSLIGRAISLPGSPVVLSDDLEMGALSGWGDLPELVLEALRARNHGVLVCKAFDRLDEIAEGIIVAAEDEDGSLASRLSHHGARLSTLRRELCHHAASVPSPDDATVEQLWEKARREAEP